MDNDPQPRAILDPNFDPVATKLDHIRALLDATNLDTDTKSHIMIAAIHYAGERALKALDQLLAEWDRAEGRRREREIMAINGERQ